MPRDRARKLRIEKIKQEIEELQKKIKYHQNELKYWEHENEHDVSDDGLEICGVNCGYCISNSIERNKNNLNELEEKVKELKAKLC